MMNQLLHILRGHLPRFSIKDKAVNCHHNVEKMQYSKGDRVFVLDALGEGSDWPLGAGVVTGSHENPGWFYVTLNEEAKRYEGDTAGKHWLVTSSVLKRRE